ALRRKWSVNSPGMSRRWFSAPTTGRNGNRNQKSIESQGSHSTSGGQHSSLARSSLPLAAMAAPLVSRRVAVRLSARASRSRHGYVTAGFPALRRGLRRGLRINVPEHAEATVSEALPRTNDRVRGAVFLDEQMGDSPHGEGREREAPGEAGVTTHGG